MKVEAFFYNEAPSPYSNIMNEKRGSRNDMNKSNKSVIRSIHEGRFNNRNRTLIRNQLGVDKSVFLERKTRNPDL